MADDFSGHTPIFVVQNVERSLAHYCDVLGFGVDFTWGKPPTYAGVLRGSVLIHLQAASVADRSPGGSACYVYVKDARRVHAELAARDARIDGEPEDQAYGLCDFGVRDLDGNRLVIASPTGD